jgi:RimJ/RimL family protein N-acetyltransferase
LGLRRRARRGGARERVTPLDAGLLAAWSAAVDLWHYPTMFPDTFQTARLIVRPIRPADAVAIFETYAQDRDVTRFLPWRPHRGLAETQAYVARCLAVPSDLSRTYAVVGRQDDQVRGAFDLRQPQPYRLGYGYVLAHRWWGQGLMTQALGEVVRWALDRGHLADRRRLRRGKSCLRTGDGKGRG